MKSRCRSFGGALVCFALAWSAPARAQTADPETESPSAEEPPGPATSPGQDTRDESRDSSAPSESAPPEPEHTPKAGEEPAPPALRDGEQPGQRAEELDAAERAELESLVLQAEEEHIDDGPSLSLYGFADVNLFYLPDKSSDNIWSTLSNNDAFFVGNLNVYLDGKLDENWRSLIEVRYLYQPNGSIQETEDGSIRRTRTEVTDQQDPRPFNHGSIEIERAYLEYTAHSLLRIQLGQWRTPFGIWNVDHGSPTLIALRTPIVVGSTLMPERQTGIQVYGSGELDDLTTAGYHLTLSNGRGPFAERLDLDTNKGVGARLWGNYRGFGDLTVGSYVYYGQYTDSEISPNSTPLARTENIIAQADELAISGDIKWTLGGFHTQAEAIVTQSVFKEGRRPPALYTTGVTADWVRWGAYNLTGYRLPWANLMPYVLFEYQELSFKNALIHAGINYRPTGSVVFKVEYLHGWLIDSPVDDKINVIQTQAAWAF